MLHCQICGSASHGFHFGVLSCRACSAFFRRTAGSKWCTKSCTKPEICGNGVGKYQCKPCRLKRCYEAGMDAGKFQFNRDVLIPVKPRNSNIPKTFEIFVGRPEYVLFCTPGTSQKISHPKIFIDVSNLVESGRRILRNGPETPIFAKNQLSKLSIGFSFIEKNSRIMKTFPHSGKEDVLDIWEFYFLTVARWLTYFDEFRKLDENLQMQLLLTIWHIWGRLDKLLSTAINRRRQICQTKNLMTLSNGILIDVDTQEVDVEWMTNYQPEQVLTFIDGVRARELLDLIDPLVELNPSDFEISYLFAELCFHYAGNRFGGSILSICEGFMDILAVDLHNYYLEQKMSRYSGRLTSLLKINSAIKKNIWENRTKIEICKTFDMMAIELSHPEMFFDTGF